ncbi:MAG: hypothetical protein ITG00_07730 [Flavobacterium sp.]|nr:hypothetical protein [Flavobacterium sp.]
METQYNPFWDEESPDGMFLQDGKDRKIDDPELNQDSTYDHKDESFDESDDFHKYDDTDNSNVDDNDPIAISNDHINENSANERPTFIRTYDKNAPDDDIKSVGKFDGTIGI